MRKFKNRIINDEYYSVPVCQKVEHLATAGVQKVKEALLASDCRGWEEKLYHPNYLKGVMFSEIDLASRGINRKAFIKGTAAYIFRKIVLSPIPDESPLKIPRHLVQLLAIGSLISKSADSYVCCLFVYYMQLLARR